MDAGRKYSDCGEVPTQLDGISVCWRAKQYTRAPHTLRCICVPLWHHKREKCIMDRYIVGETVYARASIPSKNIEISRK